VVQLILSLNRSGALNCQLQDRDADADHGQLKIDEIQVYSIRKNLWGEE